MSSLSYGSTAEALIEDVCLAFETGEINEWLRPWATDGLLPRNHFTGRSYSGTNIIMLWAAARKNQFGSSQWLTIKQKDELCKAKKIQAMLRKGSRASYVLSYKPYLPKGYREEPAMPELVYDIEKKEMVERRKVEQHMLKASPVFNLEQFEWPDGYLQLGERQPEPDEVIIVQAMEMAKQVGAYVTYSGPAAFYRPSTDSIMCPPYHAFKTPGDFACTLYHELVHWTGKDTRCDRKGAGAGVVFTPGIEPEPVDEYAFEELVAELGSAILCAHANVPGNLQHKEYLVSWAKKIRAKKVLLMQAGSLADKAAQFLLERSVYQEEVA